MRENLAAVDARRTSEARAKEQPYPAAAPPTAAITGLGRFHTARMVALNPSSSKSSPSGDWDSRAARKSAPDENALPAPVRTTTRVSSSLPLSLISAFRVKI